MELTILFLLQEFRKEFLNEIMIGFTHLADNGIIWIVIAAFLFCFKEYRRTAVLLTLSLGLCFVICNLILKNVVARVRPYDLVQGFELLIPMQKDFSFPSGHTSISFAGAVSLFCADKRFGYVAFPLAVIISFSRLYLSMHFPSDVLAGIAAGIVCGYIPYVIADRLPGAQKTSEKG